MRAFIFLTPQSMAAELGVRVRQHRLQRNLTQQQLAEMAGTSLSSIRRLEASGQGTVELLAQVAQALQLVTQLGALFTAAEPTIAEVEQRAVAAKRQRARSPSATLPVRPAPLKRPPGTR